MALQVSCVTDRSLPQWYRMSATGTSRSEEHRIVLEKPEWLSHIVVTTHAVKRDDTDPAPDSDDLRDASAA